MASIRTLKRRIKSIKSINEITKAMEMIAAVRFKRVESRLKRSLPYTEALAGLISRIVSEDAVAAHPLFQENPDAPELLVILTGDRGLCGSYNTTLLRRAEQYLRDAGSLPVEVFPVGKIGVGYAMRRGWQVWETLTDIGFKFTPGSLQETTAKIAKAFTSGRYSKIQFLLIEMSRGGAQKPVLVPFLNMRHLLENRPKTEQDTDYIFEPDRVTTLGALIELYVKQSVFITLLKSIAAEYSARMIAMKLATDNGKDLIKELTLERNKIRQAMITKEISEIIGGVAALS